MGVELASKHIEDPEIHLHRLGPISRQKTAHEACVETALRFRAMVPDDVVLQYDLAYGGKPWELRYTEIFAAAGGILVAPCDARAMRDLYTMALAESAGGFDYQTFLHDTMGDKYVLMDYPIEPPEKVVILPGSNILEQSVDKEKLNAAADAGAVLKPHPLTQKVHMDLFEREYGDQLLPKNYSGWSAMIGAETVYCALGSELGLCAELFGKKVVDISTNAPLGGYVHFHQFIHRLPKPTYYMNQILNSPYSGIFFPHSTEADFDAFLMAWRFVADRYGRKP